MIRICSFVLCGLLVATAAVVHGSATHRWSMLNPDPGRAAAVHSHVISLADYRSKDIPSELPVKERSAVSCRQYTSPSGLPAVVVSVTSGPPGAVSTHTPDVCYPGSGYKAIQPPRLETVPLPGGGEASYLVADFAKPSAAGGGECQRVRWSWSTGGQWEVPDRPRFAFLREPELYKLYVVTAHAVDDGPPEPDSPAVKSFVAATFSQYSGLMSGR